MTRTLAAALLLGMLLGAPVPARAGEALTLEQAYRAAMASHPTVKILAERVAQARAARSKAWSRVKPTLAFQGTFKINDTRVTRKMSELFMTDLPPDQDMDIELQPRTEWGYSVAAKLPVVQAATWWSLRIAYDQVDLARLGRVRDTRSFLLTVAQAYYAVVTEKEVIRSLEQKVEVDRTHLKAARAKLEVGQEPRSTVLRAELVLVQDEQKLRAQRFSLAASRRQLAILLGRKGEVDVAQPVESAAPQGSVDRLHALALATRPDYRATALQIDLARKMKQAAWLQLVPLLDLSWVYAYIPQMGFYPERHTYNFLFTLTVPLYDGGARYADMDDADSRRRQATEARALMSKTIEQELVRYKSELASAEAGLVSANKAVELAEATAADVQASFEVGAVSQLDALDASQRLVEARIQLASARFSRDVARLALAHATGTFDPLGGDR